MILNLNRKNQFKSYPYIIYQSLVKGNRKDWISRSFYLIDSRSRSIAPLKELFVIDLVLAYLFAVLLQEQRQRIKRSALVCALLHEPDLVAAQQAVVHGGHIVGSKKKLCARPVIPPAGKEAQQEAQRSGMQIQIQIVR